MNALKAIKSKRFFYTLLIAILFISGNSLFALLPNIDSIDTPTAVTYPKSTYGVGIWGYNKGGLLTKTIIGLHEKVYLGVSFDIENAIGALPAKMNVPGVIAKIKITDGWQSNPFLIAVGYDSFYSGKSGKIARTDNPFDRVVYGPYAVFTKPVFLFGQQQNFHFGVRTPVQPIYDANNTSMFASFDFPIGIFVPMIEIERAYFDANRTNEILLNAGFRFNLFESLSIELDFMMSRTEKTNRMIIFEYMSTL